VTNKRTFDSCDICHDIFCDACNDMNSICATCESIVYNGCRCMTSCGVDCEAQYCDACPTPAFFLCPTCDDNCCPECSKQCQLCSQVSCSRKFDRADLMDGKVVLPNDENACFLCMCRSCSKAACGTCSQTCGCSGYFYCNECTDEISSRCEICDEPVADCCVLMCNDCGKTCCRCESCASR